MNFEYGFSFLCENNKITGKTEEGNVGEVST